MKGIKMQKGITLIALIITIIVLLILAVVTIAAVRDNGIIFNAKRSIEEHIIGKEKEEISLAYSSYKIAKTVSENASLEVTGAVVTGDEKQGYTVKFNETENYYSVDENGTITHFESVKVPEATFTGIYEMSGRLAGVHSVRDFIIHSISAENKPLNGLQTPQIPAKLTYNDGTTEDVIFYYTGKTYDGVHSGDYDDKTEGWYYYVAGTPTLNDDGTYTGDYSKGTLSLQSYSASMYDGTITYASDDSHLLWIFDGFGTASENKLIDLVEIEILGEKIKNKTTYELYASAEKGDSDLVKNINNVKRVIVNFPDAPQTIGTQFYYFDDVGFYVGDKNDKMVCIFGLEENVDEATGKTYTGTMIIYAPGEKVNSITFEEEVDGELVMTTVKLEPYTK